jgi:hypothetical protein
MDVPTVPNISLTRYTVNQANALTINIAPNFTQYPPCDYVITENLAWTIPPGAPITVTTGNKYQLKVQSYNMKDIKTYAVVFKDTATYLGGTWSSEITFNIEVLNPCTRTTINAITVADITYELHANEVKS